MLDREREEVIKFMMCCNVTKINGAIYNQSIDFHQKFGNETNGILETNVKPSSLFSVQFRKQVKIRVLDR